MREVVVTTDHPVAQCVDLRATFGDEYRCEFEESYEAERPEFRAVEGAWLTIIPCKWGHIYPLGDRQLAAWTESPSRRKALEGLDCVQVHQDCDKEVAVVFDVVDFDKVAAVMEPKRRRRLSPEGKAKLMAASEPYRFRTAAGGSKCSIGGLEREGAA